MHTGRVPTPATPADAAHPRGGGAARGVLAAGLAAAVLFGALALVARALPASRTVESGVAYAHTGAFSYASPARRSVVYPDGAADTGETVFLRLARFVDVDFAYRLETAARSRVRGSASLEAVVSDGSGWRRSLPLAGEAPFEGGAATVSGRLDLRRVAALVAGMRRLTGSDGTGFVVEVVPRVEVVGYAGGDVVDDRFAPALPFTLDAVALRPAAGVGGPPLAPREEVTGTSAEAVTLGAGALSVTVREARALSVVGLAVSALVAAAAAFLVGRRLAGGEAERIEARHGGRLVDVLTPVPESRWVAEVADFASLLRAADLYGRPVLHAVEGGRHVYVVDDGVAVYRYRTGGPLPSARLAPAGR